MKAVKINFAGKDFYMAMTAEAMFDLRDLSGDKTILKLIQPATKEARTYLFKAVSILTEAAELARRYMGYDKCLHHLTEKAIEAMATPDDILNMKVAVAEAIALGYNREINDPEKEVDLVLQELEKNELTTSEYLYMASIVGIKPMEALIMFPGVVSDMFELWKRQNVTKREDE